MPVATAQAQHSLTDDIGGAPPRILVFDSGLGGLSVFGEIIRLRPEADYVYVGDDAVFPYGRLSEADLVGRVMVLMDRLIPAHRPDIVIIACATASTLVLPPLRLRWPDIPFVGTVPAIKPAAAASRSKLVSVLATPGTVAREYTHDLVRAFALDCAVTLVGAKHLAPLAEAVLRGETVADARIYDEIAPAFVESDGRRTDTVVLACTHYPLLAPTLARLAPWPVVFIDPAPAIARRVDGLLSGLGIPGVDRAADLARPLGRRALFTSDVAPAGELRRMLGTRGLTDIGTL